MINSLIPGNSVQNFIWKLKLRKIADYMKRERSARIALICVGLRLSLPTTRELTVPHGVLNEFKCFVYLECLLGLTDALYLQC